MNTVFFINQNDFRKWLEENHKTSSEIIVGYFKVGTPKFNMTWSESVDQALCFGWIDGIRKSIDNESYCIRFTPRKKNSIWSKVNINKVEKLIEQGIMQEEGLKAFSFRKDEKSAIYSFENKAEELSEDFLDIFKLNSSAWDYFVSQSQSYKKTTIHWINSAKQNSTKLSRLEKVIIASTHYKRVW
jgi:uncharacterized protein YdeI (YjbR/CyaY-like superfamily)